ncbi:hypothetical protein PC129_g9496 [Phytophthora cactorum]|uniref:Uncharacterized protein n=1 Tax=Phytophthora cactorum TaxID=29920 RepID=A0A8T1FN21_9STRA|nr:hypothetical protein Pcac1_g15278 [Phytophthora cactorum]KAG2821460.1 hypothetical protein PC112_g11363 [Phytophthora cactorum]KAG2912068.1 hypothetical protein PC114_g9069 [Phytophthora cactorum]KAG2929497.1 hypothetical protein PC117_g13982 [Phytophthora cactorum]KAG2973873.1 hypothetical protein PC118_g14874 [Phytophthora cactorum]
MKQNEQVQHLYLREDSAEPEEKDRARTHRPSRRATLGMKRRRLVTQKP